jgi:hypothetical protein
MFTLCLFHSWDLLILLAVERLYTIPLSKDDDQFLI